MRLIPLTRGLFAQVDDEDFERLAQHKWFAQRSRGTYYAQRTVTVARNKRKTVHMHREVLSVPDGLQCDHIDGDGLNNQRANLRTCTHWENRLNTKKCGTAKSRFIGVTRAHPGANWQASIKVHGRRYHLGSFAIEEDAARARDARAREVFGAFAQLNFREEP